MSNETVGRIIEISSQDLVLRNEADSVDEKRKLIELGFPDPISDFFSRVEGGQILVSGDEEGDAMFSFLVDDRAPLVSVNDELEDVGIGLSEENGAEFFGRCYPLFRDSEDYQTAWCVDLNEGDRKGQIFMCRIFFGEHPGDGARVWANNFESWLKQVIEDYMFFLDGDDAALSERFKARGEFPQLKWK